MKMIDHNHFICHLILGTFTEYPFLYAIFSNTHSFVPIGNNISSRFSWIGLGKQYLKDYLRLTNNIHLTNKSNLHRQCQVR